MAIAQIEPSGCGENHGLVDVRFDLFLEPDDARYNERHTLVPVIPEGGYPGLVDKDGRPIDQADYDLWLASLPHIWQLAPFHSHFLRFEPDVSQDAVLAAIEPHIPNFYAAWLQELDKLPGGMRHGWDVACRKPRPRRYDKEMTPLEYEPRKLVCLDKVALIVASNLSIRSTDIGETFPSTDIDIGPGATNRFTGFGEEQTTVDYNNAANDTGSLDTFEFYFEGTGGGIKSGTFSGSNPFTNRDVETIGTVTSGAKRTFTGKDCDVTIGDWLGVYIASGWIERDNAGYLGVYTKTGDQFGAGSQSYALSEFDAISIYATGETAGATHEGAATLSGAGTLAGIGRGIFVGKGTLAGTGSVVASAVITLAGKATLTGTGALSALGGLIKYGIATLSGTGLLSAVGGVYKCGAATLAGVGSLTASAVTTLIGKATLAGTGALSALAGGLLLAAKAALAGAGNLAASAIKFKIETPAKGGDMKLPPGIPGEVSIPSKEVSL